MRNKNNHHSVNVHSRDLIYVWEKEEVPSFKELIISWNSARPSQGKFALFVSVKTSTWSEWLPYAFWGKNEQRSFHSKDSKTHLSIFQDTIQLLQGEGTGFKIQLQALEGADLNGLFALHACTSNDQVLNQVPLINESILLNVKGISQRLLAHPRHQDLCSPTSTSALIGYLRNTPVEPLSFAQNVYDQGFDIFGNWVFNIAQASVELGNQWHCWVTRIQCFSEIIDSLKKGSPVVVSVKGPLEGSALPYTQGHLIVIKGFDAQSQKVICMDPAFLSDQETTVHYSLKEFLPAWERRFNIAYLFKKKE